MIGVPHESHGEEIKAYVIRTEGATVTEEELVAWGKEQMAGYKYPRIVTFVDSLPMTATGKMLKRELASRPEPARPGRPATAWRDSPAGRPGRLGERPRSSPRKSSTRVPTSSAPCATP